MEHPGGGLARTDVVEPSPGAREVLIDVEACAVCRTDLQLSRGEIELHGLPRIPGHQVVGRVIAVGEHVEPHRVGTRVGVAWLADTCGQCRFCASGRENLCLAARFTGWDVDGGFAARMVARDEHAHLLPDSAAPTDLAPLLCGGVIGYRSLHIAGMGPDASGARLGLFGFGASATLVLQLATYWGIDCYVVTRSGAECSRALELGAAWAGTYDEPLPVTLDAAITFAPVGDVVPAALTAVDRGGVVAINAIHLDGGIPALDYADLWWERSLRSVANVTRADIAGFLQWVPVAGIRTQTEILPLAEAPTALQRLAAGDVRGSFVLTP